jgi:Protein of unknown function (DUF4230)
MAVRITPHVPLNSSMEFSMLKPTRNKVITIAVIFAALGASLILSGTDRRPVVLSQVQALSDLVTVKYVTEQIVQLEDGNIFSKDRIVLIAHGVIKAGIDLNKVTPDDLVINGKTISVHLPPPQIIDKYLDEKLTEVSTRETGWFVFHRKDLEADARRKALDGLVTAARSGGIAREAELQAKTLIGQFFQALGYEKVEYR